MSAYVCNCYHREAPCLYTSSETQFIEALCKCHSQTPTLIPCAAQYVVLSSLYVLTCRQRQITGYEKEWSMGYKSKRIEGCWHVQPLASNYAMYLLPSTLNRRRLAHNHITPLWNQTKSPPNVSRFYPQEQE